MGSIFQTFHKLMKLLKTLYNWIDIKGDDMGKNINYYSKFGLALKHFTKDDKDIWLKKPNENAFNSNLYRRLSKNKEHRVDMEYDKYVIKTVVAMVYLCLKS